MKDSHLRSTKTLASIYPGVRAGGPAAFTAFLGIQGIDDGMGIPMPEKFIPVWLMPYKTGAILPRFLPLFETIF